MEEQIYRNCTIQIRESSRFKSYYWEIFKGRVAIGDNSKSYGCDTRERALSEARDYVDWWLLDSEDTTTQGTMQEAIEKQLKIIDLLQSTLIESLEDKSTYNKREIVIDSENKTLEVDDYYDSIQKNLDCIEDATKIYLAMKASLAKQK